MPLQKAIMKKGVKHFKRVHSDRYIGLKVRPLACSLSLLPSLAGLLFQKRAISRWITLALFMWGSGSCPDLLC